MSRGVWRIFAVALQQYQRTLEAHALLDFSGVLERAVKLLKDMDEFAESRFRLEARYRHVLVDEFQDTSRAQWELVAQLVRSWGEGFGAAADALPPSIFIVGDRKQSIYGFRDADVALLDEAAAFIEALRPGRRRRGRRSRSASGRRRRSWRSSTTCSRRSSAATRPARAREDAFRYGERDRFPGRTVGRRATPARRAPIVGDSTLDRRRHRRRRPPSGSADEIVRLLAGTDRARSDDRRRAARRAPADIAILFRSRDSHREFEAALERRGVPTYVYKGLGFFDADEMQDAVALLRYLADPLSNLRAAALLRSRVVRLSDAARRAARARIAADGDPRRDPPPAPRARRRGPPRPRAAASRACRAGSSWVDRLTPSELLDAVLRETAYAYELRGPRRRQARENLKKLRGMIRRAQNRGYATLARIADHLERLAVGDESNAAIDAIDAVSLMTVHAAKGLEFPIVFVVNMGRGTGGIARADSRRRRCRPARRRSRLPTISRRPTRTRRRAIARRRKRLLYVALTRARDRLVSVGDGQGRRVPDGARQPRRGAAGVGQRCSFVARRPSSPSLCRARACAATMARAAGAASGRSCSAPRRLRPSRGLGDQDDRTVAACRCRRG